MRKMRNLSSLPYGALVDIGDHLRVKYAILAVLVFAPLAVAGSYLTGDPTSTEVPRIELEPEAQRVAEKPKATRDRSQHAVRTKRRTGRAARVRTGRSTSTPRVAAQPAASPAAPPAPVADDDEADRVTPQPRQRPRGAAPVPVPEPAPAGVDPPDNDEADGGGDEGGTGDDGDD